MPALKSKSGASLIFVLGIMLMLFAIGGAVISGTTASVDIGSSVMGAASTNFASNVRQSQYNRAVLLSESIHRTIRQSIKTPSTNSNFNNSLANHIPDAIFKSMSTMEAQRAAAVTASSVVQDFIMNIDITGLSTTVDASSFNVRIIFPVSVNNPSFAPDGPRVDAGIRDPYTITINTEIVVEVEVFLDALQTRAITTQATYQLSEGVFSDIDSTDINPADPASIGTTIKYDKPGKWELVSYEIIETH